MSARAPETPVVAIAGAGSVGKYVIDELLRQKQNKVVVLSRSSQPELAAKGVHMITVDYDNHLSLVSALRGVHTLLSFLFVYEHLYTLQLKLIRAAEEAGVKRFAPSEWSLDTKTFPDAIPWYADKPKVQLALANSSLEYTLFFTGLFLDFLASDRQYLPSYPMPVNISALTADIPGTGDEPISLTKASDVAKYVVAAISDEAEWPEVSGIEGVRTTWNKVLKAAEEATGKKFEVKYLSKHQLEQDANPLNAWSIAFAEGKGIVPNTVAKKYPGIKPVTEEELIHQSWGAK